MNRSVIQLLSIYTYLLFIHWMYVAITFSYHFKLSIWKTIDTIHFQFVFCGFFSIKVSKVWQFCFSSHYMLALWCTMTKWGAYNVYTTNKAMKDEERKKTINDSISKRWKWYLTDQVSQAVAWICQHNNEWMDWYMCGTMDPSKWIRKEKKIS